MSTLRPHRALLFGALLSLVINPLGVAAVAHVRDYSLASVRWNLGWGVFLPLPGAAAWILFGLFGVGVYLVVAVPAYLLCRLRAERERNLATLLALGASTIVSLAVLLSWLGLWRP